MPNDRTETVRQSLDFNDQSKQIEENLFALENSEDLGLRKKLRAAIRDYQNYSVAYFFNEYNAQKMFRVSSLYDVRAVPVFLSEDVFCHFQNDYLKKHAEDQENPVSLQLKTMSGTELFEVMPKRSLSACFAFLSEDNEIRFNFKLTKVFLECFQDDLTEFDWESLSDESEWKVSDLEEINVAKGINICQKIREIFDVEEWIVLVSQITANKILNGEISRHNFDLDRFGDKRIVIFSDNEALEDFKNAVGNPQIKTVRVNSKRIFGSDLSQYKTIFIDPKPPFAKKIGIENLPDMNELFESFELENKLLQIKNRETTFGQNFVDVKEFQRYIVPIDIRSNAVIYLPFSLPVYLIQDASGKTLFPVFTSRDSFEAFRLHLREKGNFSVPNFIEPHFVSGADLFKKCSFVRNLNMIFNPKSSVDSITFEPSFALKVYCA